MKLSIIIPIYNVEKYLRNCLDSIFDQDISLDVYEVILVNDGSPDASKVIIEDFQKKYPNIIYIEQENKGVSSARNVGLDCATGTYITFVDPDDAVYKNTFKSILERVETYALDILYLNIEAYDTTGTLLKKSYKIGDDEIISDGLTHPRRTFPPTVYTRKVINTTRFVTSITIGEDTVFNAMVQYNASRCSYFSLPYYKYTVRPDSASRKIRTEKAFEGFLIAIACLVAYRTKNFPEPNAKQKDYFDTVMGIFLSRIIEFNLLPLPNKKRFFKIKNLLKFYNLEYLATVVSSDFKFFNSNYTVFLGYQGWCQFKQSLIGFAYKIKQKIIKRTT